MYVSHSRRIAKQFKLYSGGKDRDVAKPVIGAPVGKSTRTRKLFDKERQVLLRYDNAVSDNIVADSFTHFSNYRPQTPTSCD